MARGYSSDEEREIKLLKPGVNVNISELPSITVNPGLDAARMWYLFEEVRPYCPARLMDKVCPRPNLPKTVIEVKSATKVNNVKKKKS